MALFQVSKMWRCNNALVINGIGKSFAIRLFAGKRLVVWKQSILRKPFVVIFHDCTMLGYSHADARDLLLAKVLPESNKF